MKYKVIKGHFYVTGYSPDGDSIRFSAENDDNWDFFVWKKASNKKKSKKQLRLEAIDALETHYEGAHQPRSFGIAALEILLEMLGITDVTYNIAMTKINSAADETPGVIVSSALDMYDRPVSFVFADNISLNDGDEVDVSELPSASSINLELLKLGLVYPTFYSSMEDDLITVFAEQTRRARNNKTGVWALDRTKDFTLWNKDTIQNDIVILPKLFRRLTTFFIDASRYEELPAYLKRKRDKVLIRSTGEKKKLHEIIEINGRNIRFLEDPENLVFDPKG